MTVIDPNRRAVLEARPVSHHLGRCKAVALAINVAAGGEAYAIAFATDAPCSAANVDTGGVVRETLSDFYAATPTLVRSARR